MSRDYAAEMRTLIDAEASGTYVPGMVAAELAAKLRATDPELLTGWLDAQAEQFLRLAINDRDRSQRTHARLSSKRSAFAADAEAAENGEPERLAAWLDVRFTVADGSRAPLRSMTADDLLFVGDAYESRANENRMTAAFLRAIARRVGPSTVGEHFTDEQLSAMWSSLGEA